MALFFMMLMLMQSLFLPADALQVKFDNEKSGQFMPHVIDYFGDRDVFANVAIHTFPHQLTNYSKLEFALLANQTCKIKKLFQYTFHGVVKRIGEAKTPGPMVISTFNPTQLLGRENDVSTFLDGVWTGCETSHTVEAMAVTQNRFKQLHVNAVFSQPADKHSDNKGVFRGKAVGTAVMSRFPLQPYPEELDADVRATCPFSDAIVRLRPDLPLYICALYGPPENNTVLMDSEKVFVTAARPGVERAMFFKDQPPSPVISTGHYMRCHFGHCYREKDGLTVLCFVMKCLELLCSLHAVIEPESHSSWSTRPWPSF
jgi:hypothetical protein